MVKLEKSFFIDNEVLYWDQTKHGILCPISKGAYKTFIRHGINVQSVGPHRDGRIIGLNAFPKIPQSAYVLYEKKDEKDIIPQLIYSGVKHLLFHPLMAT